MHLGDTPCMNTLSPTKKITLKQGKESAAKNFHPWIFSGAVHQIPQCTPGEVVTVESFNGEMLGQAYVNPHCSLLGRFLSFGKTPWQDALRKNIQGAIALRKQCVDAPHTNAWRVINGEGDGIPGLVVDKYDSLLVLQSHTAGIDCVKDFIVNELREALNPTTIYERSLVGARKEEGLEPVEGLLYGEPCKEVWIQERGNHYLVSLERAQKTGFFLDQREMRELIGSYSSGMRVLNCFSFSGGFSVAALRGGAREVASVDVSSHALTLARENVTRNFGSEAPHTCIEADVLNVLPELAPQYDLIILDPPAFAKKREHVTRASKGYYEINFQALKHMKTPGLLLTCSCSHFMDEQLFKKILFRAAKDAQKQVSIISFHRLAADHPVSIYHPEGGYLKSFLVSVQSKF
jgi:23S rRNA (cytosine1962-C5)-methyltransferase